MNGNAKPTTTNDSTHDDATACIQPTLAWLLATSAWTAATATSRVVPQRAWYIDTLLSYTLPTTNCASAVKPGIRCRSERRAAII